MALLDGILELGLEDVPGYKYVVFALFVTLADTELGDEEPVPERVYVTFALFVGVTETTLVILPVIGAL